MTTREEAAAKAIHEESGSQWYGEGSRQEDASLDVASVALRAADSHDAAHGVHRLVIDDATVERAARAAHDFLNVNYPCGCSEDEMCPGNSYEAYTLARAVLAAAVQEGQ